MKFAVPISKPFRGVARGFTILELWISMAIGTMCLGAVGVMYVQMAKEQRSSLANAVLEQKADDLQDQLTKLFLTMSATTSATLGSANATNAYIYRTVVLSKGLGKPQEQVTFDTVKRSVTYDPNINVGGDTRTLWRSESNSVVLRDLYFSLGLKAGNRPDGTLLTVTFKADDDYAARRRKGSVYAVNELNRQFTIRLRGP